jgi:urease accessory protein
MLIYPFKDIIAHETTLLANEEITTSETLSTSTESEGFWGWTKEAELGPATTWPLGEVLMARHDMQHSRIFNS